MLSTLRTLKLIVRLGLLFPLVFIISSSALASCSKTLFMAYPAWNRDHTQSNQDIKYGLDNELLKEILDIAECPFEYTSLPFRRIQEGIRRGQFDGTIAASKSPDRTEYARFSAVYRPEIIALFMRTEDIAAFNPKSIADLMTIQGRISVGIGTWHGSEFENFVKTNPAFKKKILYIDDNKLMQRLLVRKRINAFLGDLHFSSFMSEKINFSDQIKAHPFYILEEGVHIMLSKQNTSPSDIQTINKAIEIFQKTERYSEILNRYTSN